MPVPASRFSPAFGSFLSPSTADLPDDWIPPSSPFLGKGAISVSDLMVALGADAFDGKGFVDVFGDGLTFVSLDFVVGNFSTRPERTSLETFNVTTLLFFENSPGSVEGVAGGVDIFESELGARRRLPTAFGGPGILLHW